MAPCFSLWRSRSLSLRAALGRDGANSRAAALARVLNDESEEFRELWERHEVAQRFADRKTLVHPEVGAMEFDCQVLFTEDQSQALLVLTPSGKQASERLRLLSVVGAERFAHA